MTGKELKEIWLSYKKTDNIEDRNKLVKHYYQYVKNIASKIQTRIKNKLTHDELTSLGLDGLYDAIEGFDLEQHNKFETYSYTRIFGSIIDNLRQYDWVPRSVHLRQSAIEKIKQEVESELGEKISNSDVLKRAGINEIEYHRNSKKFIASSIASIETNQNITLIDDNKKDFNKYLESKNTSSPDSRLIRKEFISKLIGNNFTSIEKKIIYYYYYEGYTIKQIKEILDVPEYSESRLIQLKQKIIKRLKTRIQLNPNYFSDDIVNLINLCNDKSSIF
jgi:RNA polymerase sigma factor for flagellar operon FliA